MTVSIQSFYDVETFSWTHLVWDTKTLKAALIDPVLNFDRVCGKISTDFASDILAFILKHSLELVWILETHVHADHLTASQFFKQHTKAQIAIGEKITSVLNFWTPIYDMDHHTPLDGSQFDKLLKDRDHLPLGNEKIKVFHTPGHTASCVSYLIGECLFVGDLLFMPDVGCGRTDFPGGGAESLYESLKLITNNPETTKIYTAHDYPPSTRKDVRCVSTLKEQLENNPYLKKLRDKKEFIKMREERDHTLSFPTLLLYAIQFNLNAGKAYKTSRGISYLKIPLNQF